jgi:hypothetical protein
MNTPRYFPGGINEAQEKSNQELSVVSRTTQQKSSSQFPWLIIGLLAHHQIQAFGPSSDIVLGFTYGV